MAPQPCWAGAGHKVTLPSKRHVPRREGTNSCTHASLGRGNPFGKDNTGECGASVDVADARNVTLGGAYGHPSIAPDGGPSSPSTGSRG
jgi:hypothetical protein